MKHDLMGSMQQDDHIYLYWRSNVRDLWRSKDTNLLINQAYVSSETESWEHTSLHRGRAETVYRQGCPSCSRQHF